MLMLKDTVFLSDRTWLLVSMLLPFQFSPSSQVRQFQGTWEHELISMDRIRKVRKAINDK